jgi:hypothetical protein
MCGIAAVFGVKKTDDQLRNQILEMSKKIDIEGQTGREFTTTSMLF